MDSAALRSWLFATERYLKVTKTSPDLWVLIASSFLSKHAALWFESWYRQQNINDDPTAFIPWEVFGEAMKTTFLPPNHHQHMRARLDALRQTGSLADYIYEFRNIRLELQISDEEALHAFVRGLKQMTQMQVRALDPETTEKAIAMADRLENAYQSSRRTAATPGPRMLHKPSYATALIPGRPFDSQLSRSMAPVARPPTGNTGPTPMILDQVTTRLYPTAEQRETMKTKGECFRCGRQGHIGAMCPSFPSRVYSITTESKKEQDE